MADITNLNFGKAMQVDPTMYPQIKCDKCGYNLFKKEVIMYDVPGVALGAGSGNIPYPIPVYVCANCGTIMKAVREELEAAEKKAKENAVNFKAENTKGTNLIL